MRNWRRTLFLVLLWRINPRGNYFMRKLILRKTDPSMVENVSDIF